MLTSSSKELKFSQSRLTFYIKLIGCLVIIITPLVIFQIVILNANKRTRNFDKYEPLGLESNEVKPIEQQTLDDRLIANGIIKNANFLSGELFDVDNNSSNFNRTISILRVARSTPDDKNQSESIQLEAGNERVAKQELPVPVANETNLLEDGSESRSKTMVLVSSKNGKFSELLPLDELIVSPTAEQDNQQQEQPVALPEVNNNSNDAPPQATLFTKTALPSLSEQSQLFSYPNIHYETDANGIKDDNVVQDASQIADLAALHSYNLNRERQLDGDHQQQEAPNEVDPEPQSLEQMPDSFEGLMGVEAPTDEDSATEQEEPQNPSSTNQFETEQNLQMSPRFDNNIQAPIPALNLDNEVPVQLTKSVINKNDDEDENDDDEEEKSMISSPMIRNSVEDLHSAAGHHYGKKKKKKIIIKKKKYKKKKKKIKKIKIVKKKVIKKKKKKKYYKKPKKMHHDHGKYYMYAKVPKKKSWEFGFKKGNKKHWIERHEKGHKNKFKTKVKWYDKKSKGKGLHIWDYNHHDKKKKKHYG